MDRGSLPRAEDRSAPHDYDVVYRGLILYLVAAVAGTRGLSQKANGQAVRDKGADGFYGLS